MGPPRQIPLLRDVGDNAFFGLERSFLDKIFTASSIYGAHDGNAGADSGDGEERDGYAW